MECWEEIKSESFRLLRRPQHDIGLSVILNEVKDLL